MHYLRWMSLVKRTSVVVLLLLPLSRAFAQYPERFLHVGLGPVAYKGDLQPEFTKFRSIVTGGILYNRKKRVNGELNLAFGRLFAARNDIPAVFEDGELIAVNNTMSTSFVTFSFNLHVNIIQFAGLKVYAGPGIGLIRFQPEDAEGNGLMDLPETRLEDEEYINTRFAFPLQLGAQYVLKSGHGVSFQANFMNPATDYLDNIGMAGSEEGNDQILSYRFSLILPFNKKTRQSEEVVSPDSPHSP